MTALSDDIVLETLRLAIASHYSQEARERWLVRASDSTMDWSTLCRMALAHGLGPLLYAAMISAPALAASSESVSALKRDYQLTGTLNKMSEQDLVAILQALQERAIPVAMLKGAALLQTVYGHVALRPMADIDLLVQFADLEAALDALSQIGYAPSELEPFENLDGLFWNELLMCHPGHTNAQLELHWNLLDIPFYATRLSAATLLDRAHPIEFGHTRALVLAPVDMLLHLCAHNVLHHQSQLWRTDVDIAFMVSRYSSQFDWDMLITEAVDLDLVLSLKESVSRASELWFAPVPKPVLDVIEALKPRAWESAMISCQRSEFLKVFRTLLTLPGLNYRFHFLKGQFFPSKDYLTWRYNLPSSAPVPIAYTKRYWSGVQGLLGEIFGHVHKV